MKRFLFLLLAGLLSAPVLKAQLVINEVSQGTSGNKEYIELVTMRVNCTDTAADIRNWVVDDNGGWFGTGAVSPGCIRFKNDANWASVPFGSIILLYNSGDKNVLITMPDDPTDANNDKIYIVPVNSSELEMNAGSPSGGTSYSYPSTGFSSVGNWTNLAMNNNGDAIVVVNPANLSTAYHSMSYGSIAGATGAAQLQFSASGGGTVLYNKGSNWNAVNATNGFTNGTASSGVETPGAPNTAANATWIASLQASGGGAAYNQTINDTICVGQTYTFGTAVLSTSGTYKDTFASVTGCDSIVTLNLLVSPPPPAPTVSSPISFCQFSTAGALTAGGNNLIWYTTPTGGSGSATAPVPNTNSAGTQFYYVAQSSNGCESPRVAIEVDIIPQPAPPTVSPVILCLGSTAAPLTATGQNLLWYTAAAGGVGLNIPPIPSTLTAGSTSYYVTQTVDGCESLRQPLLVTVFSVTASFTVDPDTLCAGVPMNFAATSTSSATLPLTHSWTFGDGGTSILDNQDYTYTTPGSYRVQLVSSDANGCKDSTSRSVLITPAPQVSFTLSDSSLCEGDSVAIRSDITPGYSQITWDFGDGTVKDSLLQPTHGYDTSGDYAVIATALYDHCPLRSDTALLTVHAYPQVTLGPDTSICLGGEPIVLTNTSARPDIPMHWNTGETSESILVRHHGIFYCTATDAGCSTTDTVVVNKSCYIDIPNVFTPNGDGTNDYFFPRQLLSRALTSFEMQIYNRWGQLIFETRSTDGRGWDGTLNGQPQPTGVYVYTIKASFANNEGEAYQGNVTLLR